MHGEHKVNLVFVTHDAKYGNILDSLEQIKTLSSVNGVENIIRIYEFN